MPIVKEVAYYVILIALFLGLRSFVGENAVAEFSAFMTEPYVALWRDHQLGQFIPSPTNPFVVIILIALAFRIASNSLKLSRHLAGMVVAFLIFRVGFWLLDAPSAAMPSNRLLIAGSLCLIWLVVSGFAVEGTPRTWLVRKLRALRS